MRRFLMGFLLMAFLGACQSAQPVAGEDSQAISPVSSQVNPSEGFVLPITVGTKFNGDQFGIGAGSVNSGPYLDENGDRQEGLHANLSITVKKDRSQNRQLSVHEGQTFEVAGYRILVEGIGLPERTEEELPQGRTGGDSRVRGYVTLRFWAPPQN